MFLATWKKKRNILTTTKTFPPKIKRSMLLTHNPPGGVDWGTRWVLTLQCSPCYHSTLHSKKTHYHEKKEGIDQKVIARGSVCLDIFTLIFPDHRPHWNVIRQANRSADGVRGERVRATKTARINKSCHSSSSVWAESTSSYIRLSRTEILPKIKILLKVLAVNPFNIPDWLRDIWSYWKSFFVLLP